MDTQDLQKLKNKYDIVGNDPSLNRALEMAVVVVPTDLTVLVSGESGAEALRGMDCAAAAPLLRGSALYSFDNSEKQRFNADNHRESPVSLPLPAAPALRPFVQPLEHRAAHGHGK